MNDMQDNSHLHDHVGGKSPPESEPERIEIHDGELLHLPALFPEEEADRLLHEVLERVAWEQHEITFYARRVLCPRLSAWYGDLGARYSFSGLTLEPRSWIPVLLEIKRRVERRCGHEFNSVLANLYRDGSDSIGWHSDDEPELGERPVIAAVTLGAGRPFLLRHNGRTKADPLSLTLGHGSLLVMRGDTQRFWKHSVPKIRRSVGLRVNLTYRRIIH